jgi:hypothetical protein
MFSWSSSLWFLPSAPVLGWLTPPWVATGYRASVLVERSRRQRSEPAVYATASRMFWPPYRAFRCGALVPACGRRAAVASFGRLLAPRVRRAGPSASRRFHPGRGLTPRLPQRCHSLGALPQPRLHPRTTRPQGRARPAHRREPQDQLPPGASSYARPENRGSLQHGKVMFWNTWQANSSGNARRSAVITRLVLEHQLRPKPGAF